jgi:hypothetical protein
MIIRTIRNKRVVSGSIPFAAGQPVNSTCCTNPDRRNSGRSDSSPACSTPADSPDYPRR